MAARITDPGKLSETEEPVDKGYAAWKRAKIEQALSQVEDRSTVVAARDVWRKLGLED